MDGVVQCVANYLADDDQLLCHLCDAKSKVLNDDGDDDFSLGIANSPLRGQSVSRYKGSESLTFIKACVKSLLTLREGEEGATTHARSIIASWVTGMYSKSGIWAMFACKL